ncbi:ricin B lectin domain-containing protein [Flagelloscypha sp. PMI_526]|nr:ricin B lectin domain-containing protein [Flagelloscypha sp. PMI_526]
MVARGLTPHSSPIMKYLISLASLVLLISHNLGQALALRGCQNYVTRSDATVYELVEHVQVTGGGTRCTYNQFVGSTGPNPLVCNYNAGFNRVSGFTTGCPASLPLTPFVGKFLIKFNTGDTCATILGTPQNGAKVAIKTCDKTHDYPGQAWTFDGQNIRQGNLCLDVKGGKNNDGTPLQVWTCTSFSGNTNGDDNRKFDLDSGNLLLYGNGREERFVWSGKGKCVDLPKGDTKDGNQLQVWSCSGGPNQNWELQVVNP